MIRQLSLFLGSVAASAALALTATAQEYCDGGCGARNRGPAIATPVELYGVHPPACQCCRHGTIKQYYAPVAPTPTCRRWHTTCYTPYYCGYCPHRLCNPKPAPYGANGWGDGPMPDPNVDPAKLKNYGPYTSVLKDDTIFWLMGGNGLVPYGAPRPPSHNVPDLVDMIQEARGGGPVAPGGPDGPEAGVALLAGPNAAAANEPKTTDGPAIEPPGERLHMPAGDKPMSK